MKNSIITLLILVIALTVTNAADTNTLPTSPVEVDTQHSELKKERDSEADKRAERIFNTSWFDYMDASSFRCVRELADICAARYGIPKRRIFDEAIAFGPLSKAAEFCKLFKIICGVIVYRETGKDETFTSEPSNTSAAPTPQRKLIGGDNTPYLDGSETRMPGTVNVQPQLPGAPVATKSRATSLGVRRLGVEALNVASSPFGAYDKALIYAVQSRWYEVLNTQRMDTHAGTVELKFDLLADGSVAKLEMKANNAGPALGLCCQKAIIDSAPFAPLPEDLKRLIGGDSREIILTFYY